MKKLLSTLVLSSFLGVLLAPLTVSAALPACPNQCQTITQQCLCGPFTLEPNIHWCHGGAYKNSQADCRAALGTGVVTSSVSTPEGLIALIVNIGIWIARVLYAVAVVLLILAGFFWVTAGGNPDNVTKARTMLINALVGVAIALAAQGGVMLIQNLLGIQPQ